MADNASILRWLVKLSLTRPFLAAHPAHCEAHGRGLTGGDRTPSAEVAVGETATGARLSEPLRWSGFEEEAHARQPRRARDACGSRAVGRCSRCQAISVENGR